MPVSPAIARALGYPYPAPTGDFMLRGGVVRPLDADHTLAGRTPVLGIGSNRAPEQLRRKFGDAEMIPVTTGCLEDHDVVYSAHMASYGSIPAVLIASPGTTVTVSLTWLTPGQLDRMHETEAIGVNYDYGVAESLPLDVGPGRQAGPVGCYLGRRGALALDGAPIALAEVEARGRRFDAAGQPAMIARVHAAFASAEAFEPWLEALIGDRKARMRLTASMARHARPTRLPAFKTMDGVE